MPAKRRKIAPTLRDPRPPAWAVELLAGRRPAKDSADWGDFVEWTYLQLQIPGLPPGASDEGKTIWARSR